MPGKVNLTSSGVFQDAEGNPLVDGYLELFLSGDAVITGQGGFVTANIGIKITLDSSGQVAAGQSIWGTDIMSPGGLVYKLSAFSSTGQLATRFPQYYAIEGSSVDLSTLVPSGGSTGISSSTLAGDADVFLSGLASGQVLTFNATTNKWNNAAASGGGPGGTSGTYHGYVANQSTATGYVGVGIYLDTLQGSYSVNSNVVSNGNPTSNHIVASSGGSGYSQLYDAAASLALMNANILSEWRLYGGIDFSGTNRYWIGMGSTVGTVYVSDTPNSPTVAFRFHKGTDTNWQAYVGKDSSHQVVVDTGVLPDTDFHQFRIANDKAGNFYFYIDGTQVAVIAYASATVLATTTYTTLLSTDTPSGTSSIAFHSFAWWSIF